VITGLSRTVSEINGDNCNSPTPCIWRPRALCRYDQTAST